MVQGERCTLQGAHKQETSLWPTPLATHTPVAASQMATADELQIEEDKNRKALDGGRWAASQR